MTGNISPFAQQRIKEESRHAEHLAKTYPGQSFHVVYFRCLDREGQNIIRVAWTYTKEGLDQILDTYTYGEEVTPLYVYKINGKRN